MKKPKCEHSWQTIDGLTTCVGCGEIPSEDTESYWFATELTKQGYKFTHFNNEFYSTSWLQKTRSKKLGVSSGIPDYMVIVEDHLVFIELKRQKKGVVSETQKDWIERLNKCKNVEARVCCGSREAIQAIEDIKQYLKEKDNG